MSRWPAAVAMAIIPILVWVAVETVAYRVWSRCDVAHPDDAFAGYVASLWSLISAPWGIGLFFMCGGAMASAALWAWSGARAALALWLLVIGVSYVGFLDPATWGVQETCQYFWIFNGIAQMAGIALTLMLLLGLIWKHRRYMQDPNA